MRDARRWQKESVVVALLVACGSSPSSSTIANKPTTTPAIEPDVPPDVSSCRAVVTQEYDDGHDEFVDPNGNKIVVTTTDVCGLIIEPIYFTVGSARLVTRAADNMASMLACTAQTEGTRYRVEVIGHASADEPDPEGLGLARAKAVEQYFTACGVPVLGIQATSAGAREPIDSDNAEHRRAGSRRVTFQILERDKKP